MRTCFAKLRTIAPAAIFISMLLGPGVLPAEAQAPRRHLPWHPLPRLQAPPDQANPLTWPPAVPATVTPYNSVSYRSTPPTAGQPLPFPAPPGGNRVMPAVYPGPGPQQQQPAPAQQPQNIPPQAFVAPAATQPPMALPRPAAPVRVAERPIPPTESTALERLTSLKLADHPEFTQRIGNEHPIMPALRWAKAGLPHIDAIDDYCCTMVKQERVNGELKPAQHLFLKVRHRPFSVYVYFLTPEEERGQEAIYVAGQNNGNLVAHAVGLRHKLVGAVSLKPDGMLAMQGARYPITNVGLANLVRELVAVGENDIQYGESEVAFFQGAKVNGRVCTCVEFKHPVQRKEFRYHMARIFVDDELNLPVHYEAYDWPTKPGAEPLLTERYTYLNLKISNRFTDADFDPANPAYGFAK